MTGIPSQSPIKIFFSYAHADKKLRDEIDKHLTLYRRKRVLTIWFDRAIQAGIDWQQEIDIQITAADVILLLISADFLASDYCYGIEMQTALQRHQSGSARVIPIILRPVHWQIASFSELKVLPTDGKPIESSHWYSRDEALEDVARGIYQVVEDLLTYRANKHRLAKKREPSSRAALRTGLQEQHAFLPKEPVRPSHRDTARIKRNQLLAQKRVSKTATGDGAEDADLVPPIQQPVKRALYAEDEDYPLHSSARSSSLQEITPPVAPSEPGKAVFSRPPLQNTPRRSAIRIIPSVQSKKWQLINEGDGHYNDGNFEAALAAYERAVNLDPKDADLYNKKGNALYCLEKAELAFVAYDGAIQRNPDVDIYYSNKAGVFVYLSYGSSEEALRDCDKAIQLNPGNIDHYALKARALFSLASYQQTITVCDQILQFDPDNPAAYQIKSAAEWHLGKPFRACYFFFLSICSKGLQKIKVVL